MKASRRVLSYGLALDIDGVLLKGSNVLPGAREALAILKNKRWPFVLVTNGGGMTETQKAKSLTKLLGVNINENQILMSHTPYRDHVETYKDKRVLIIGSEHSLDVAKHYGFTHPVSPRQLLAESPTTFKQIVVNSVLPVDDKTGKERDVHAAFILGDPFEWGLDIQILTDVMLPPPGDTEKKQRIPLYACNADIVYNNEHAYPRYTQGAFVEAFRALYERHFTLSDGIGALEVEFCGKPFGITYRKVEDMLRMQAARLGIGMPHKLVAIGDSPHSDIKGANLQNPPYMSILLRTGVWNGDISILSGENGLLRPSSIQDGILDAIASLE